MKIWKSNFIPLNESFDVPEALPNDKPYCKDYPKRGVVFLPRMQLRSVNIT